MDGTGRSTSIWDASYVSLTYAEIVGKNLLAPVKKESLRHQVLPCAVIMNDPPKPQRPKRIPRTRWQTVKRTQKIGICTDVNEWMTTPDRIVINVNGSSVSFPAGKLYPLKQKVTRQKDFSLLEAVQKRKPQPNVNKKKQPVKITCFCKKICTNEMNFMDHFAKRHCHDVNYAVKSTTCIRQAIPRKSWNNDTRLEEIRQEDSFRIFDKEEAIYRILHIFYLIGHEQSSSVRHAVALAYFKLLCSGDVEENPGPVVEVTFTSYEDWESSLPSGRLTEHTDLDLCPIEFRRGITVQEETPGTSGNMEEEDINISSNNEVSFNNTSLPVLSVYTVPKPNNVSNVPLCTTRPELANNYSSSITFKMHEYKIDDFHKKESKQKYKRKLSTGTSSQVSHESCDSWKDVLLSNIQRCAKAVNVELSAVEYLQSHSLISTDEKCLIQTEDSATYLAESSRGIFQFSVFKIDFESSPIFYVRFIESGCYDNFMSEVGVDLLLQLLDISRESLYLHQVVTNSDIHKLLEKNEEKRKVKGKKGRKDMNYSNNLRKLKLHFEETIVKCQEQEVDMLYSLVHAVALRHEVRIGGKSSDDWCLFSNIADTEVWKSKFSSFPLDRVSDVIKTSVHFSEEIVPIDADLLSQSQYLNYLSNCHLIHPLKQTVRFLERFLNSKTCPRTFRCKLLWLYLKGKISELYEAYNVCRSHIDMVSFESSEPELEIKSKKPRLKTVRNRRVSRNIIMRRLEETADGSNISIPSQSIARGSKMSIFESYSSKVVQDGTLVFHVYSEDVIILILNDYSSEDGHFHPFNYVHVSRERQEEGYSFRCTCVIFRTILDSVDEPGDGGIDIVQGLKCMHCRFLNDHAIASVSAFGTASAQNNLHAKVLKGLEGCNGNLVCLKGKENTKKFSVYDALSNEASFVSISQNVTTRRFIVSCLNGYCRASKGAKKNIEYFDQPGTVICYHLKTVRDSNFWQDLKPQNPDLNDDLVEEVDITAGLSVLTPDVDSSVEYFDEGTGLWKFPSRSTHVPKGQFSQELSSCIQLRDTWNDLYSKRLDDGALQGPEIMPPVPDIACECGSNWVDFYKPDGVKQFDRNVTIYTELAPVTCAVYFRRCLSHLCDKKIKWDEGESLCVHVYSNVTAAGDEIGWKFVDEVLRSKITFSAFCINMTNCYRRRFIKSKQFMDAGTFLKWWFGWASAMKIDFRTPCSVCKYSPKQLACDGTRVGIGFRNADFIPIETSDCENIVETLHRRMDRCFMDSSLGIASETLQLCRKHLHYLSGGSYKVDLLCNNDDQKKSLEESTELLLSILPVDTVDLFTRFVSGVDMGNFEYEALCVLFAMLSTTAPLSAIIPLKICPVLSQLLDCLSDSQECGDEFFNSTMQTLRKFCPEVRNLISGSMSCHSHENLNFLPGDVISFLKYLIGKVTSLQYTEEQDALVQPGTYNPAKYGRAYYFSPDGCKLRNIRKFSIDSAKESKNTMFDDVPMDFESCKKIFSKAQVAAKGSTTLFLWFCPNHGHCYGFHMSYAEGRKDPYASLYSHLELPPEEIFYDYGCGLQEYCLNRESGYYSSVRFFHDIFHGYSHKCSSGYRSSRLQGFEAINSEICEQFNSFIQCIKSAARQMNQTHFCFYLQFFLNIWNKQKLNRHRERLLVALAGSE